MCPRDARWGEEVASTELAIRSYSSLAPGLGRALVNSPVLLPSLLSLLGGSPLPSCSSQVGSWPLLSVLCPPRGPQPLTSSHLVFPPRPLPGTPVHAWSLWTLKLHASTGFPASLIAAVPIPGWHPCLSSHSARKLCAPPSSSFLLTSQGILSALLSQHFQNWLAAPPLHGW